MGSLKNPTFRGEGITKNQYRGGLSKKGAWTVCRFKGGGAWKERAGGDFKRGGWYPNPHYENEQVFRLSPIVLLKLMFFISGFSLIYINGKNF